MTKPINPELKVTNYFLPQPIQVPDFNGDCKGMPTDWWFPPNNPTKQQRQQQARAIEICKGCHAVDECRSFAVEHPSLLGIWGATTPKMRRRMRFEKWPSNSKAQLK